MTEMLCLEPPARGRGSRRNRPVDQYLEVAPSLATPKELYTEARRLVSRNVIAVNLSRAVFQDVRNHVARVRDTGAEEPELSDAFKGAITFFRWEPAPEKPATANTKSEGDLVRQVRRKLLRLLRNSRGQKRTPAEFAETLQALAAQFLTMTVPAVSESLVTRAQGLVEQGSVDEALDVIYEGIDDLLLAGSFDQVDQLLRDISEDGVSSDVLVALLTVTLPAKSKLPSRADFYSRVERTLSVRSELEDGLLSGLE